MFRSAFHNKFRSKNRARTRKKFASGKNARAICDRSGFEYPMTQMVIEPGTGLLVHRSESDGRWNRVTHPRNFPPDVSEAIGLRYSRPDRIEPEPNYIRDDDGNLIITDQTGLPIYYDDDED